MSENVVSLIGSTTNSIVIERLEELLTLAKSGEIEGFACATVNINRSVGSMYVLPANIFALLGSMRLLEHDILRDEVE